MLPFLNLRSQRRLRRASIRCSGCWRPIEMRVLLIGFGAVGRSFVELIGTESKKLAHDYGLRPKIVGIVDSKGAAISPDGIEPSAALASKKESGSLEGLGHSIYRSGMKGLDAIKETDCEVV